MKVKVLGVVLMCVVLLTGCVIQSIPSTPSNASTEDSSTETTVALQTESVPATTEPTVQIQTAPPETTCPEPQDEDFVNVVLHIPDLVVDLKYATDQNFTGQIIYDSDELWLRYGTVKKLMAVQEELKQQGLYLKVWDGFRPPAAQWKLWEVCPDPQYVSNPNNGFSSHSRGNTVDITLVYADGREVTMPTGFDDFSKLADRDYSDCETEVAANALLLEQIMIDHGFKPYSGEWWHFSDTQSYPVEHDFAPGNDNE